MPDNGSESSRGRLPVPATGSGGYHRREYSEDTPLLKAVTDVPFYHSAGSPDETLRDNELAGDEAASEYEHMLERAISCTSQLGIEVESQQSPMLRGSSKPRHNGNRRASRSRRSSAATRSECDEAIPEGDEYEDENEAKSPFHRGITVRTFWLIFGGIMMNTFISCFDSTIMASSHPVITSYFRSSNSASWLSTSFLLTSTAFQPLYGRLSDTMGRKLPYIFGMALFVGGTLWCALAQSMTSFILGRALCGLGAGGMLTMGSIIISDMVPIEVRGIYQSYLNILFGLGSALGAASGGAMADYLGWRWEFGVQVPPLLLCLVLACINIPRNLGLEDDEENESFMTAMKTFDYKGSILLTAGATFLILALSLGGNIYPWTHPLVLSSLVIFLISAPLLVYVELHSPRPIMPLSILAHAPRANLIFSNFLAAVVINAILFNIPIYFQAVLLESATASGLRLLVPTISATISGVSTGFLITWTRRLKWPVVLGATLIFLGPSCLVGMTKEMPTWLNLVFLVPSSLGQGFQFPGTFMAILALSEQAEQAVVTSTLILWRSLGMVLGIAASSLVLQNALVGYLEAFVTGPDKERVILEVRESIEAIVKLEPHYRHQVVDAYAASLRITFIWIAAIGLLALVIVAPIRMPRLGKRYGA